MTRKDREEGCGTREVVLKGPKRERRMEQSYQDRRIVSSPSVLQKPSLRVGVPEELLGMAV